MKLHFIKKKHTQKLLLYLKIIILKLIINQLNNSQRRIPLELNIFSMRIPLENFQRLYCSIFIFYIYEIHDRQNIIC